MAMQVLKTVAEMKGLATTWQRQAAEVCLVPTMGALHEGHIALVREAARHAPIVVVSIFVNPIQFGPKEDFDKYPRDLKSDLEKLEALNVTCVFAPTEREMYPEGFQTRVVLEHLPNHLCGIFRPGHFAGVATVVLKLFQICKPTSAVFGLKDYQQVLVIERMVKDLNLDVKIIRHPTVREPDGLAMSSRNAYLSPEERAIAPELYRTLCFVRGELEKKPSDVSRVIANAKERLARCGFVVQYFEVVDADTLEPQSTVASPCVVAAAVYLGATRLIDNVEVVPKR